MIFNINNYPPNKGLRTGGIFQGEFKIAAGIPIWTFHHIIDIEEQEKILTKVEEQTENLAMYLSHLNFNYESNDSLTYKFPTYKDLVSNLQKRINNSKLLLKKHFCMLKRLVIKNAIQ